MDHDHAVSGWRPRILTSDAQVAPESRATPE
jgi:hypothetical protein